MLSEVPPHEKIRFRRGDIASLDRLPSAVPPVRAPVLSRVPGGALKAVVGVAAALALLVALAAGIVFAGIGDERLRLEAEAAIDALAGEGMSTRIGGATIAFDGFRGLALEVGDARVAGEGGPEAEVARVGSMRFGLRFAPLLRGALEVGRVRLRDARLDLSAMPGSGGTFALPVFDDRGLLDTDAAAARIFAAAQQMAATFQARGVDSIELENVDIVLSGAGVPQVLSIASATVRREAGGALTLAATLEAAGRDAVLEGGVALDAAGAVDTLRLRLDAPEGQDPEADRFGAAVLEIAGRRQAAGPGFTLSGRVANARLPLGREGLRADLALDATADHGTDKLEIDRLRVTSGRSAWSFHGAVGPMPAGLADAEHGYRFELVSDGSTVAPVDSPEPALVVAARVAGRFDAAARRFDVDEIAVRSPQAEAHGNARLLREPGISPGIAVRIEVENMPVGQAKQLWPRFAAAGARNWVIANVFGGRVETGRIELDIAPGSLDNRKPLTGEEVKGRFAIRGTRFDVAGRIPPVRDAVGLVDFAGTDVDITLESGTAYSPSGRVVGASDGRLAIRQAHVRPVIGKLDIHVEGAADAILELAGYEPIAVGRFIDLKPDDVSGTVSGKVAADIPLQRDIPVESLGWRVELAYENLALARPIEGQTVSQAAGSIVVDPARAVIEADALLNGAKAKLSLVEPLGRDKTGRQRRVAMQMDDSARRAIAPGLDTLLSGPAQVELADAAGGGGRREVRIGLDRATLSLPWLGWSKGGGVPASAAFALLTKGGRTELSDFRLDGESFGAAGALSLVGGALERARFPSARLNRGDDFSVDVQARGRGYAVTVRGKSLDVRSAVKLHMKDSAADGSSGDGTPVSIDLEVASMTGFHGEVLHDVKFAYSGSGSRTDRLEFSGTTASGRTVAFSDRREGDARTVAMRSADAGAVLRFLDIYRHMEGGSIELALAGSGNGPLSGHVDARDFVVVNETRLSSIASTAPQGDTRSLNQAVRGEIDTSRVAFERGFARIVKTSGALSLNSGILRGPAIGMSLQGSLYDRQGNIALTGTFMPAYGLNRIFGEIPLIGQILGNGRDRGLIGITFRLSGKADEPQLQVNPLSVIAPGIFRSVFEFR